VAAEANLERALTRAGDCEAAYREAMSTMRRQFNLAFFKRLLVGDDDTITAELAEPFDTILDEELRRAVIAKASDELTDAVDEALRQRETDGHHGRNDKRPQKPTLASVGAVSASGHSWRGGFSPAIMVRMRGLEPPPGCPDTDLNRARLPIPPHPRVGRATISQRRRPYSDDAPRSDGSGIPGFFSSLRARLC
jgi:hypothetical protein